MNDVKKTKKQLIDELAKARSRIDEMEKSEVRIKLAAQEAREYAESIVATVREPLVVLDGDLRVVSASRSFYQTFKVSPEETIGRMIYDLGNRQWDIPKLRELLEDLLPTNTAFDDFEVEHDFETIGQRNMLLNARRIYREANKTEKILLAIEDITECMKAEDGLHTEMANLDAVFESSPVGMFILDETTNIVWANAAIVVLCGGDISEVLQHRPGNALRCVHSTTDPRGCGYRARVPALPRTQGHRGPDRQRRNHKGGRAAASPGPRRRAAGSLAEARILAVSDVVEAMSSSRPYRQALGVDKALREISEKKSVLYDQAVVDSCLRVFKEKAFSFEE